MWRKLKWDANYVMRINTWPGEEKYDKHYNRTMSLLVVKWGRRHNSLVDIHIWRIIFKFL